MTGVGASLNTDALATELLDALDRNTLLEPISARQPDFNADAAYDVGAEILRRRRARGERAGIRSRPAARAWAGDRG
jgi:hypothetical protein